MRTIIESLSITIVALCAAVMLMFSLPATGWKAFNVATGSMTPAVVPGSLVVDHAVPTSSLHIGDVVTYKDPKDPSRTITHRIVAVRSVGSNHIPIFVTKGDANQIADPPVAGGSIVGKVMWHVPALGGLASGLHNPWAVVILVVIPGMLVMVSELERLVATLVAERRRSEESPRQVVASTPGAQAPPNANIAAKPPRSAPLRPTRKLDGLAKVAVITGLIACCTALTLNSTGALLKASASLTSNTLATAGASANHLVINQIILGAGTVCGLSTQTISISNIGPGSTAKVDVSSDCTITSNNSSSVSISNNSSQTATSGNASSSSNTSGGNATSGSVSNSSTSSTTTTVSNGSSSTTPAAEVQLYNPTSTAIPLSGWSLKSASASQAFSSGLSVPAHGSIAVVYSAETLQKSGGRLLLVSPLGLVDAVSWGSDTSQLNPAAPAIGPSGELERTPSGVDTNTAADWTTQ